MQGITNVLTKLINDKVEEIYINTERFRNSTDRKDVYKYLLDEGPSILLFKHLINDTVIKDMIDFADWFYCDRNYIVNLVEHAYLTILKEKACE
jgi:hypothetical protein